MVTELRLNEIGKVVTIWVSIEEGKDIKLTDCGVFTGELFEVDDKWICIEIKSKTSEGMEFFKMPVEKKRIKLFAIRSDIMQVPKSTIISPVKH